MVQVVDVLKHCPSPLLLHDTLEVLNWIQRAAVLRQVPRPHSLVESIFERSSVVHGQVVHVHHCLPLDLPHHLNDEVLEGLLVVSPANELEVHKPLLLADGGDDRDGGASRARHLQHHVSANPGPPWY